MTCWLTAPQVARRYGIGSKPCLLTGEQALSVFRAHGERVARNEGMQMNPVLSSFNILNRRVLLSTLAELPALVRPLSVASARAQGDPLPS